MDNRKLISNAVVFPATAACNTVTNSAVINSVGMTNAEVFAYAPSICRLGLNTGCLFVTACTSSDGCTYLKADQKYIAYNGTDACACAYMAVPVAKYLIVSTCINACGGLQAGHGATVDVVTVQKDHELKRVAGQVIADSANDSITLTAPKLFEKVMINATVNTATATCINYDIFTSNDGTKWWKVHNRANLVDACLPFTETLTDKGFGKYVKLNTNNACGGCTNISMIGLGY